MKVKTNLRAGAQTRKGSTDNSTTDTSGQTTVVYYPPVTRCISV